MIHAVCLLFLFQDVYSKTYLIETADDLIVAKPIAAKETPGYAKPPQDGRDYAQVLDEGGQSIPSCVGHMGSFNFSTPEWIEEVTPCASVTFQLGENEFYVSKDEEKSSPVKINRYPITVEEYQQALDGETVELENEDGKIVELKTTDDGTLTLDGKALTNAALVKFSKNGFTF